MTIFYMTKNKELLMKVYFPMIKSQNNIYFCCHLKLYLKNQIKF